MQRVLIGNAPVDNANAEEAAKWVLQRMQSGTRTSVTAVNAAIAVLAGEDPLFRTTLAGFDLLLADGFWTAMGASLLRGVPIPHANTSPFVTSLFAISGNVNVFLLGARPAVVERAATRFRQFHPNGKVVGYTHGYFSPADEPRVVQEINESGATVLLLGISSPQKEYFITRHYLRLKPLVCVGVGGLFDIWSGHTREAPPWVRAIGLEWGYRWLQEPRRLWTRYTTTNRKFAWLLLTEAYRVRYLRAERL